MSVKEYENNEIKAMIYTIREQQVMLDYDLAKHSIIVIDDYISIETLDKLNHISDTLSITIISDNKAHRDKLQRNEFNQFIQKHPHTTILKSLGKIHDRFIILDYDTKHEIVNHCGTSSKDAGSKMCTIIKLTDISASALEIQTILANPPFPF